MTSTAIAAPGQSQAIHFKIDTSKLQDAFERGAPTLYYWMRSALRRSLIDHRVSWLSAKSTRFGRGDDKTKAIKVWKVDEAPAGIPEDNWVVYRVHPTAVRMQGNAAARAGIQQLSAEIHAGSTALKVHQEGIDIQSNEWMAIAVKTRPKTPKKWRAANPGKDLILRPSKKNPREMLLFEIITTRGPGKGKEGPVNAKWRLRFRLRRFVDMKPTLKFYESWDAAGPKRDEAFRFAADRIISDIAKGITK